MHHAFHVGGLLARTDACPAMTRNNQSCQLAMSDVSISEGNIADGAGGGLLVTKIASPWVRLAGCSASSSLNLASTHCLQQPNKLCQGRGSLHRLLLQADAGAASAATLPTATSAADSDAAAIQSDYIATSAAFIHCQRVVGSTDAVHVVDESCSTPVRAGPGIPINIALVLRDGFNRTVSNGTFDASMPLQVRAHGWLGVLLWCGLLA